MLPQIQLICRTWIQISTCHLCILAHQLTTTKYQFRQTQNNVELGCHSLLQKLIWIKMSINYFANISSYLTSISFIWLHKYGAYHHISEPPLVICRVVLQLLYLFYYQEHPGKTLSIEQQILHSENFENLDNKMVRFKETLQRQHIKWHHKISPDRYLRTYLLGRKKRCIPYLPVIQSLDGLLRQLQLSFLLYAIFKIDIIVTMYRKTTNLKDYMN